MVWDSHLRNSYDIIIKNITGYDFVRTAIRIKSGSGGFEITDNELKENGWNLDEDHEGNLVFANNSGSQGNNIIARNYIHDAGYASGSPEPVDCIVTGGSSNIYIYDNHIYAGWENQNSADLISIRGGSNRYIYNNVFELNSGNANQNIFISGSNGNVSNTHIYNNLFYKPNSSAGSPALNINYFPYTTNANLNGLYIFNNTMYGQKYSIRFGSSVTSRDVSNVEIKNNIFLSNWSSGEIYLESPVSSRLTVDYNFYYQSAGQPVAYQGGNRTLSYVRSNWGWETHGDEGDPEFDTIGANGFDLRGSSPVIDKAQVDPGSGLFSDDKNNFTRGNAWDIGAYEYSVAKTKALGSPTNLRIVTVVP